MSEQTKLKRVVIKEELVALTGNYVDAIILGQFLYWTERVKDYDAFLMQEASDLAPDLQKFGWIYKSARELSEETMLNIAPKNMRNHILRLIDLGFILKRENQHKWDRRIEYKLNIKSIQTELQKLGYALDSYPLYEKYNGKYEKYNDEYEKYNGKVQKVQTVTEITTETTTEKKESKKEKKYDAILSAVSDELKKTYWEFIKMRKLIKSPMTDRALEMLVKKVDNMAEDDKSKILILEQSILNNWKSVYPLKKDRDGILTTENNNSELSETERMLAERRKQREELANEYY